MVDLSNVLPTAAADPVLVRGAIALLVDHKFFVFSAWLADEFVAPLAFVDPIEPEGVELGLADLALFGLVALVYTFVYQLLQEHLYIVVS